VRSPKVAWDSARSPHRRDQVKILDFVKFSVTRGISASITSTKSFLEAAVRQYSIVVDTLEGDRGGHKQRAEVPPQMAES